MSSLPMPGGAMDTIARANESGPSQPVIAKPQEFSDSGGYKPPHEPSGSSKGGQFTSTNSGSRAPLTYSGVKQGTNKQNGGGGGKKAQPNVIGVTPVKVSTLKKDQPNDPESVRQLQALLSELKLGDVGLDGTFGDSTEAAVKSAQERLGLKPTGRASASLIRKLHDGHALSPCVDKGATKVTAAAGKDVTPGHDQLHHFWTRGEGLARWINSPTPWTTLVALLSEHVTPEKAKTFASAWLHEVTGLWAGSDAHRVAHGHPPRGKVIGPG